MAMGEREGPHMRIKALRGCRGDEPPQPLMKMSSVKRSINPPGGHMGGSAVYAGQCLAKGRGPKGDTHGGEYPLRP